MGCTASHPVSVENAAASKTKPDERRPSKAFSVLNLSIGSGEISRTLVSPTNAAASSAAHHRNDNVQDEARSFRSKVSAIKMLARQTSSYESFRRYLEEIGKSEYLVCFCDIEEIKRLEEDQIVSRTYALVFRYKALYEEFKMSLINHTGTPHGSKESNSSKLMRLSYSTGGTSSTSQSSGKHLIWECLGKLKSLDYTIASGEIILKNLTICQNDLIARLVMPFESFLQSNYYKLWQEEQLELEKQRKQQRKNSLNSTSNSSCVISPRNSIGTLAPTLSNRPDGERYSNAYPDILIVDDSNITLKITGKTLEQDGHHVEKATNGQIALQLMKSRTYDIVLIDCNMPVMDGFEAVRHFREYEKQNSNAIYIPSDVSSISDSQEDPVERAAHKERHRQAIEEAVEKAKQSDIDNTVETPVEDNATPVLNLKSEQAEVRLHSKLKRGLTAAHYHQLIIGMSTNIDEETRKRALDAGMDYFLPKPFTLQKFIDTIRLSRERRTSKELASSGEGKGSPVKLQHLSNTTQGTMRSMTHRTEITV